MEVKEMIRILRTHPVKFPFYGRVADKLEQLNDFNNSQCVKLLKENGQLKAELQEYKDAEGAGKEE